MAPRRPDDFYPTPAWCVDRLLDAFDPPGTRWIDLGAGEGALIRAVQARRPDVTFTAVERRAACGPALAATGARVELGDAGAYALGPFTWDVALSNPPFAATDAFVHVARAAGTVAVVLLRLRWIAATRRAAWLGAHPCDLYVLPNRPSFTGTGARACDDYAWAVWPGAGRWQVLAVTPPAARRPSPTG